jgi:hypothetical protein
MVDIIVLATCVEKVKNTKIFSTLSATYHSKQKKKINNQHGNINIASPKNVHPNK